MLIAVGVESLMKMQQKLCELLKIIKKLVGHDIKGISRSEPQNMESDAVVSMLDLTHQRRALAEPLHNRSLSSWKIPSASYTMRVHFYTNLSSSHLFLTKLLPSSIICLLVLSKLSLQNLKFLENKGSAIQKNVPRQFFKR